MSIVEREQMLKGSTLVETLVATLIIVVSFMAFMAIAVQVHRRSAGFTLYMEMRQCRDSVITGMARDGEARDLSLLRPWGTLQTESRGGGEVAVRTKLVSGQTYELIYLVDAKEDDGI